MYPEQGIGEVPNPESLMSTVKNMSKESLLS
jgi:hypothetical protein